jgi:hypothetical protein
VARSAEPVARGPGSARPSAIQPPSGIRPLQLTSEVSFLNFFFFFKYLFLCRIWFLVFNFLNFTRERCTKKNKVVI